GNLAAGGRRVAQPLTYSDRKIAETLAPILSERGLFVIGLDIIGDKLTEINVTSPTCFVEIAEQSDFHVPNFFAEELERVVTTQGCSLSRADYAHTCCACIPAMRRPPVRCPGS